jgi:hypothetical protein
MTKIVEKQDCATVSDRVVIRGGVVVNKIGPLAVEPGGCTCQAGQLIRVNHRCQDSGEGLSIGVTTIPLPLSRLENLYRLSGNQETGKCRLNNRRNLRVAVNVDALLAIPICTFASEVDNDHM